MSLDAHSGDNYFVRDIVTLSEKARACLRHDSPQDTEKGKNQKTVELLQFALTAEIVCVIRYTTMAVSVPGLKDSQVSIQCLAQATDERGHMMRIAQRIEWLEGVPEFAPTGLKSTGSSAGAEDRELMEVRSNNLEAEKHIVGLYRDLIVHFSGNDPLTSEMFAELLQDEEAHVADMQDLLASLAH